MKTGRMWGPGLWAVLGLLAVLTQAACAQRTDSDGLKAPDVSLKMLNGRGMQLSGYRGQVVLLNFWATWCLPCREEILVLAELFRTYKDRGVAVIGVSMDWGGTDKVKTFVKKYGIPYPIAMTNEETMKAFSKIEGVPTVHRWDGDRALPESGAIWVIPTTFVIDREGKIYRKHPGARTRERLEREVKKLLGEDRSK